MDYEKAYKESFGVAQCLHEAGDTTTKKQMERLFPQLAESDDYRNWKKVKRAIRIFFTNPTESNELLAWLEKQKEQKPVECIDFDNEFENQVSHLLASILNGEHEYNEGFVKYAAQSLLGYAKSEMKPDEWDKREKLFTKALQTANAQIGQLFEENKKLKEQKPANDKTFEEWIDDWWKHNKVNNPDSYDNGDEIQFDEWGFKTFCRRIRNMYQHKPAKWSDEDSRMLSDIAGYISGVGSSSGITKRERVDFLSELPKRFNLQPKQEWSEEDKINLNGCICSLHQYGYMAYADFLKHIPERFSLHPRQEWSEEDMNAINAAATIVEGKGLKDIANRLKSIRPQSHWKPSKEQMKALYSALNDAISLYSNEISPSYEEISRMHFDVLESLYNDLKKL